MDKLKYKGIIFDLDGTLVDTVDDLTDALNLTLRSYNLEEVTREEMKRMIGNGLRRVIVRAVPEKLKDDENFIDEALINLKENYSKIWVNKTVPFPGVDNLLSYCIKNNIKLGVSSNKVDDATNYIIKTLFPDVHFDAVLGNREGMPHKPNPEQTDLIVEKMRLNPEEILYVGDSEVDVKTALNSHLTPVILNYGYGDYERLNKIEDLKILERAEDVIPLLSSK